MFFKRRALGARDFQICHDAKKAARFDPRFQGENLRANLELVDRLTEIAKAKGVKASQLAIAWTTNAGRVPIPGTRRIKDLEENVAAADITLTRDELAALEQAAPIGAAAGERYSSRMLAGQWPVNA